jgi:membrane protein YqaA with SNARE-associated domain
VKSHQLKKLKFFVLLVVFLWLAIWLATLELEGPAKDLVTSYGYAGFLLISFVGGLNLFVPLPHLVLVPLLLEAGLNPWVLGIISTVGATSADAVGYWLGHLSNQGFPDKIKKFRDWALKITRRWPALAPVILFLWASLVPVPNEVLVVPLGIANWGLIKTMTITFAGNLVFNLSVIHTGNLLLM